MVDEYNQQPVMLNADEKINELGSLLEQQQLENDHLREQLEATDSFKSKPLQLRITQYLADDNADHLKSQVELNQQEKQAYYMISNDIQSKRIVI